MNKITTDHGSWELFNNNDGNWMALPIGNPSFPTFEGSTIGSVSYQIHNYVPKEEPKMATGKIKSVGVQYSTANASDQEIQDFFDWCVERGATVGEGVRGVYEASDDKLFTPNLHSFFGVVKTLSTRFTGMAERYGHIVNTIEEAKDLIDPSWREGVAECVENTATLPKTPAQKLGYKVGDKFLVRESSGTLWVKEDEFINDFTDVVTLVEDDYTDSPEFICEATRSRFYLNLRDVMKIDEYKTSPVVSDGGSSPYYRFKIRSSITGEEIEVETGDVIRAMVGNDFDLGNILKACRRISEAKQGRGKAGTDVAYDCNKIAYFAEQTKKAWEG